MSKSGREQEPSTKMGISGAVDWWEEWQLRILVLGSLLVQWFLFFSAPQRKHAIHSWFRSLIWLAYLGSDAIAIYALANLFSRQRRQDCSSGQANSILEVVWAPILLMHLGGYYTITAYNIEDNELWTRHVLTAVSQIIVAIYVFWKSWPGGDKRLLQVAILFFTAGILKCLMKPWALKGASINSLISYHDPSLRMASKEDEINSLEEYVRKAGEFFKHYECQGQGEGDAVDLEFNHPQSSRKRSSEEVENGCMHHIDFSTSLSKKLKKEEVKKHRLRHGPYRLFVDRASSYSDRLSILQRLWVLNYMQAYVFLQRGLSVTFELLYTKRSTGNAASEDVEVSFGILSLASMLLPFAAIGLFHKCNRDAYDVNDVKVTYALICCTAVLELCSFSFRVSESGLISSEMVSQYSLLSFFVRNKRHSKKMCILSSFNCKDFLDQHWCMESCSSSSRITELVRQHVKVWWKHIVDAASYRRFNDHRGQWTIQHKGCDQDQEWGLDRPFDESVLLWHIATDLCFYQKGGISASHGNAEICREISNYMVYLLFVKPEMLLPGSNRNLFNTANAELEGILEDDKPLLEFLKRKGPSPEEIEKGLVDRIIAKLQPTECREEDPGCTELPPVGDRHPGLVDRIIAKLQPTECRQEHPGCTELPPDGDRHPTTQEAFIHNAKSQPTECREEDPGCTKSPTNSEQYPTQEVFIQDALKISKALLDLGDDIKMWGVIEGVWVEMLCYAASRCRGYLHAKSLGSGGELLTYIWLLLSHMGMETLPERLQRTELPIGERNAGTPPWTSQTAGSEDPRPHEAAAARTSTSRPQEILPAK